MSKEDNGGPAFPSLEIYEGYDEDREAYTVKSDTATGMSLRDYFAAKAMAKTSIRVGLPSNPEALSDDEWAKWWEWSARHAYLQADAMLKARE